MRIVLDTNVLVSAMLKKGSLPHQLLAAWDSEKFDLVTSEEQLSELDRVLNYDKLQKFIPAEKAGELVARLRESATSITDLPDINYSTDPVDNLILATAIAGQAELLVSGDKKHLSFLGESRRGLDRYRSRCPGYAQSSRRAVPKTTLIRLKSFTAN